MKKKQKKQYIVFDIDSGSIGAMLIERQGSKKDTLVHYKRTLINHEADLSFDDFFLKTQRALDELCQEFFLKLGGVDFSVYCNLSAPWVSSQKREFSYSKNKEFVFSESLMRELIEKEIDIPHTDNDAYRDFYEDLVLIERRNLDVYLNGYPDHKPYGKKTKTVEVHSLASVMSESTKKVFDSIIERNFHRVPVYFSNTFMNYRSLKTVLPYEDNVIIADVSARNTEISLIKSDHLTHVGSIPIGTRQVILDLATKLSMSFTKTQALVETSQQEILDPAYEVLIKNAMQKSFAVWRKELYLFVDEIAKDGVLPSTICLSTDPSLQEWFATQLLSSKELGVHMHAGSSVSLVDMKQVFSENKKNKLDLQDQNMLMIHAFINDVYEGGL